MTYIPVAAGQSFLHGSREDVGGERRTSSHSDVPPSSCKEQSDHSTEVPVLPLTEVLKQVKVVWVKKLSHSLLGIRLEMKGSPQSGCSSLRH